MGLSKILEDTWDSILDSPDEEIRFLLDPYIPEEGVVILHGPKSVGKSPTVWNMGLSVAAGTPWCGLTTSRAPVLYIETDTPRPSVRPRLQKLRGTYPRGIPFHIRWLGGMNLTNLPEALENGLKDANTKVAPRLVIFNTMRRAAMGLDFNASETPSELYEAARALFPGAALLFVHHDRKHQKDEPPGSERERLSGSLAWANDAQSVLHLSFHGADMKLEHTGCQVAPTYHPLFLRLVGGSHLASTALEKQDEARRVLASLPSNTTLTEQDAALASKLGCSTRTARRLRASLGLQ